MLAPASASTRATLVAAVAAAMLLAAAVGLTQFGADGTSFNRLAFDRINPVGAWAPELWSMLSVIGLGLSVFVLMALWLAPARGPQAHLLAALLYCYPIGGIASQGFKHLLQFPRPAGALGAESIHVIGTPLLYNAMPSGHSVTAFAFATLLSLGGGLGVAGRAAAWLLALGIVLSRIATGAHWPADVCAGAALGILTGLIGWALGRRGGLSDWLARPAGQWLQLVALAVTSAVLFGVETGYPLAVPLQQGLGVVGVAVALVRAHRLWRGARQGGPA